MMNDISRLNTCIWFENSFSNCLMKHSIMVGTLWLLTIIILYSFVWSVVGRNCSKVDQIWSITPWLYCWLTYFHYYCKYGVVHKRLLLMCVLMSFWGLRLTYNFWRRGGYGNLIVHEEDYRWPILRSKMTPLTFLFFNLTFIASYQNILLWLIAAPALIVYDSDPAHLLNWDRLLTFLFYLLLGMETMADQQQCDFQQAKHSLTAKQRLQDPSQSIRDGFLQTGLWKYSRHPNYFAEQAIWVCMYMFSLVDYTNRTNCGPSQTGDDSPLIGSWRYLNWSVAGCLLLILLFQGSTAFGESITASKYPSYALYQKQVSQCIPWFQRKNV